MGPINDSSALIEPDRVWPQHQAALTLIIERLQNPELELFSWLDLACGKGQIISHLKEQLSESRRRKLRYYGFDVKADYRNVAMRMTQDLNLAHVEVEIGDISNFPTLLSTERKYNFITFTNTVHELDVQSIPMVIIESLIRLTEDGCFYMYDMERIDPLELGAVTWTSAEILEVIKDMFEAIGIPFVPEATTWRHKTRNAWGIILLKRYLGDETVLQSNKQSGIEAGNKKVVEIIESKLDACRKYLSNLTIYGPETPEETANIVPTLYNFWSLTRAVGEATR